MCNWLDSCELPVPCDLVKDSIAMRALQSALQIAWDLDKPQSEWGFNTNVGGCITSIRIYSESANGTIPAEIGDLSHLEDFWIQSGNKISGPIPAEIGKLTNLKSSGKLIVSSTYSLV